MATDLTKNTRIYLCEKCQCKTANKYDYSKHLLTKKHLRNTSITEIIKPIKYSCDCGKEYNDRAGLWKHKKKCNQVQISKMNTIEESKDDNNQNLIISSLVKMIIENNNSFHNKLLDLLSKPKIPNNPLLNNKPNIYVKNKDSVHFTNIIYEYKSI
jgi:hypothetical protein